VRTWSPHSILLNFSTWSRISRSADPIPPSPFLEVHFHAEPHHARREDARHVVGLREVLARLARQHGRVIHQVEGVDVELDAPLTEQERLVPVQIDLAERGVVRCAVRLELRVDGELKPLSDLTRSETSVRLVMLFDNSGSLTASRDFEKHAAVRFFQNVMRPMDEAAIYSISTDVFLAQPMTNNVRLLQQTIDNFGRPEGATSLYDGIFAALFYLKPFSGRRVIVIVSDGRDTTSRNDHDFDATLQKLMGDESQIYVVQTGLYDNANVRDLAAERRMEQFAAQTGGAVYIPKTVDDLDNAFAQIAGDLAQQYVLSYYATEDKRDGRYHLIALRVKTHNNIRIRARKGFLVKRRAVV